MALKGNLQDFNLNQLLNLINLAHKTGELLVHGENGHSESAYLFFQEGKLIRAEFQNQPARLTDVLLKLGRITSQQAEAVRRRSRVDTDKELGLLLIHSGYISQNDILQALRTFLLESVYRLFTWPSGEFRFEPNRLPPQERLTIPLNVENIILEGVRRRQESERLLEEIPDLDVVLRLVARHNGATPSNHSSPNLKTIQLGVQDWNIISSVNSQRTLREIAEALGMGELEARRAVQGLLHAGLVELVQMPGIKRAAAKKPEQEAKREPALPAQPAAGAKVSRGLILRIIDGIRRR